MNKKIIILANNYHPLYSQLEDQADLFLNTGHPDWETHDCFKGNQEDHLLFDFTVSTGEEKELLLQKINFLSGAPLISDLACCWGDLLMDRYQIAAAHTASFYSPKQSIEVKLNDKSLESFITSFFERLNLKTQYVTEAGIGFHYPRVVSMIINEAFLAFDDHLAQEADIDQAMKYGVNYPHGPFEWAEKIGPRPIVMLLDEMAKITGSPRYKVSTKLRKDMLLGAHL